MPIFKKAVKVGEETSSSPSYNMKKEKSISSHLGGIIVKSASQEKKLNHKDVKITTKVYNMTCDNKNIVSVNNYVLYNELGKGSNGVVKLAKETSTGDFYAMKIISKKSRSRFGRVNQTALNSAAREINVLKQSDHPNIVNLIEVIDCEELEYMFLVYEYLEKGAISWQREDEPLLGTEKAGQYFLDIVHGLEYLHSIGFVHRDLKPSNILVSSDGRVKLSDFGESVAVEDVDSISKFAGTPAFLPPEICKETCVDGKAADVWSLGVTLYCLISGRIPFGGGLNDLYSSILNDQADMSGPYFQDEDLKDLINGMLRKNPEERFTLQEILQHPWVKQIKVRTQSTSSTSSSTSSTPSTSSNKKKSNVLSWFFTRRRSLPQQKVLH